MDSPGVMCPRGFFEVKMKKLITTLVFFGFISTSHSADLVYTRNGQPESKYEISHSTITLSSVSISTIPAVDGWRKIYMRDLTESVSVCFRIDGSTNSLDTVGWMMKSNEVQTIESNGAIYLKLFNGVASKVINFMTMRK